MGHHFKAGDMALIVGAEVDTANVGKTCELVELLPPMGISQTLAKDGRPVRNAHGHHVWLMCGDSLTQRVTHLNGLAVREEKHLMPLRGDFAPELQKAKEAEPCF